MNNDIEFIKKCAEITDGWEIIKEMLTDERDFSYFSTYIKAPNRTSIDVDDIKKDLIYFPLLISQTADKLAVCVDYDNDLKKWECCYLVGKRWLCTEMYYKTANEARIAGIKEVLRGKNE